MAGAFAVTGAFPFVIMLAYELTGVVPRPLSRMLGGIINTLFGPYILWAWLVMPYNAVGVFGEGWDLLASLLQLCASATIVGLFTVDLNRSAARWWTIVAIVVSGVSTILVLRGVTGRWPIWEGP